ncbi:uncharacterized protein PHALS_09423 [Plasmopara halstedii]|uniref:Uncharacterized protein n=1 Tax=Plasmopara halstedii TaxID=4781 RepID=A0A0P1A5B2_PLAHL|nr:uncharacterized protein PHALS_09423 [Plasmopara halstedii]CEG35297.1 hypothetical protein PHALS_09423 [Plasmopara halstedii]|eukprot:XP_024571666.1 hypothetical protein PHALS_09423 [Plasmopara halstedii]
MCSWKGLPVRTTNIQTYSQPSSTGPCSGVLMPNIGLSEIEFPKNESPVDSVPEIESPVESVPEIEPFVDL